MKLLLVTSALLGLAATIGSASADPITLTNLEVWNAVTPGNTATSPDQQASPANPLTGTAALANGAASTSDGMIGLNVTGTGNGSSSTIGQFLASDPDLSFAACTATCQGTTLSTLNFAQVTLFKFTFTVPSSESPMNKLTGMSDDGESLFLAGTTATNLFPAGSSDPRFEGTDTAMNLVPGDSYDLYYASANGNPETLITSLSSSTGVPEPTSMTLLGTALIGLGWLCRPRRKTATKS